MHWTQKPENRKKLAAAVKRMREAKPKRMSAATRSKISKARIALFAAKKAALNGHAAPTAISSTLSLSLGGHPLTPPIPITGKRLAKKSVMLLAAAGARARLAELERECDVLRIFLKAAEA